MKAAIAAGFSVVLLAGAASAQGYNYVSPYARQDGTYVQPHYRTNPDSTTRNNWTTAPNVNPFTGQQGTRSPEPNYGGGGYGYGAPRSPSTYGTPRRY